MADTETRLKISATDQVRGTLQELAHSMRQFGNEVERTTTKAGRHQEALIERVAGGLTGLKTRLGEAAGAWLIGKEARESIVEFGAMERRMNRLSVEAKTSAPSMRAFRNEIVGLADKLGLSIDQTTSGMESLVKATGSFEKAKGLLPSVSGAAQAMGSNIADTARAAQVMVENFGVASDRVPHAFSMMSEAARHGKLSANELAVGLNELGPAAQDMGYKGEEGFAKLLALMQSTRERTASADQAFAGLRDVLNTLINPRTVTAFEHIGQINLLGNMQKAARDGKDLMGTFEHLTIGALQNIAKAAGRGNQPLEKQMDLLGQLFHSPETRRAMEALLMGRATLTETLNAIRNASDTEYGRTLNIFLNDTAADLQRLGNSYTEVKESLGKALLSVGALQIMREFKDDLESVTKVATALGKALDVIRNNPLFGADSGMAKISNRIQAGYDVAHAKKGVVGTQSDIAAQKAEMEAFEKNVASGRLSARPAVIEGQRRRMQQRLQELETDLPKRIEELEGARKRMQDARKLTEVEKHNEPSHELTNAERARRELILPDFFRGGGAHDNTSQSPSSPGSATEKSTQEGVKEQKETNTHLRELIEKMSYTPGGDGDGGTTPSRGAGGGASGYGGGGRFNMGAGRGARGGAGEGRTALPGGGGGGTVEGPAGGGAGSAVPPEAGGGAERPPGGQNYPSDAMAPAGTPGMRRGTATVTAPISGRKFQVDSRFAQNFQGFLNDYEKAGGRVGPNSGGVGERGNASYHPVGRAIDVNQIGRNIRRGGTTLPRQVEDSIARKWGLRPGSSFRNPDAGHFEVNSARAAREALVQQGVAAPGGLASDASRAPGTPIPEGRGGGMANFQRVGPSVMRNLMRDFNINKEQAAAVLAHLGHESGGLQAGIQERRPLIAGSRGGLGWAQWTGPRRRAFESFLAQNNMSAKDPNANYAFFKHEIQTNKQFRSIMDRVRGSRSYEEAYHNFYPFESGGDPRAIENPRSRHRFGRAALGFDVNSRDAQRAPSSQQGAAPPTPSRQTPEEQRGEEHTDLGIDDAKNKLSELHEMAAKPIQLSFHHDVQGARERGMRESERSMNRDIRRGRYNSFSDVGVA